MWSAFKLFLLLSTLHLVASVPVRENSGLALKVLCPEGQYNYRGAGFCFNCTTCAEFLYEQEKCTETRNTVCGWCGKEPNFAEISDTVLASYQTKCMMSRLDFVNMGQLKDELNEEEEMQEWDAKTLRMPNDDYNESSEEDSSTYNSWYNDQRYRNFLDTSVISNPDYIDSDESGLTSVETGDENDSEDIDSKVSESVNAYMIEKSQKIEPEENTRDLAFISRDEVEASLKRLVELVPVSKFTSSEQEYDMGEDSNERVIKWDKWLDDKVKPIQDDVEIVEAEEVQKETYIIVNEELDTDMEYQYNKSTFVLSVVQKMMICLGFVIIAIVIAIARNQMRAERRVFYGVPTNSQDYHMIVEASHRIEELEKKEKQAARHIHDNPVFDI